MSSTSSSSAPGPSTSGGRPAAGSLEEATERFLGQVRRGATPSIETFARRYADHAEEIARLFPTILALEGAAADEPPLPDPSLVSPGASIGEYRVVREIGRGGMGVVLLAEQETMGRRVALKLLPPQSSLDRRFLERFRREARAAGRLQHPHIVQVFGVGEQLGLHYYAMQYIEGEGLDRVLRGLRADRESGAGPPRRLWAEVPSSAGGEPPTDESEVPRAAYFHDVARIGIQVAEALAHAHSHGVLHRDVKPANLIMDARGSVWITDFGLCRIGEEGDLSGSHDMLGTLRYMAPEQVEGRADVRSDVYGLGVTLYELITLHPAFREQSRVRLMQSVLHGAHPRPRRIEREVPPDLEAITLKAMATLPEERYGTAAALADDLRAFVEHRPVVARVPGVLHLIRLAARRNRALTATVLAAAALVAAMTAVYVGGLQRARTEEARQGYLANIAAAGAALRTDDTPAARRRLGAAPEEHRGWEWRHLSSRLDESLRTLLTRSTPIEAVAWSPDGRTLVVSARDQLLVGDAETGVFEPVAGMARWTYLLAFSGDSRRLLVASRDETLRLLTRSAEGWTHLARSLPTHAYALDFHSGGELIAVGLDDSTIRLFDGQLEELRVLRTNAGRVMSLAFDRAGKRLVAGARDGRLFVWDLEAGTSRSWPAHEDGVRALSIHPDGRTVATCAGDPVARVWDLEGGGALQELHHARDVSELAFDPRGGLLVTVQDRTLRVWDARSGTDLRALHGPSRTVSSLAFHPAGARLVSGAYDGTVKEWDVETTGGRLVLLGNLGDVWGLAFDPSGRRLAAAGRDCTVRIWDLDTARPERVLLGHGRGTLAVAFAPDGERVASTDADGTVIEWDVEQATVRGRLAGRAAGLGDDSQAAWDVLYHSDGRRLYVARQDGSVELLDLEGRSPRRTSPALGIAARSLAIDAERGRLAVGYEDGSLRLLDVHTLALERTLEGHDARVSGVAFAPDGQRLASVSHDRRLVLWNPASGARRAGLAVEEEAFAARLTALEGVGFLDGGRRLATASGGAMVVLLDPLHGEEVARLEASGSPLTALAVDAAAGRLAAAGWDGRIHVWDTRSAPERVAAVRDVRADHERALALVTELQAQLGDRAAVVEHLRADTALPASLRRSAFAVAQSGLGDPEELYLLARALVLAPEGSARDHRRIYHLARALLHTRRRDPRFHVLCGAGLMGLGHLEEALRQFEIAGGMTPEAERQLATLLRATTLARLGRPQDARRELAELAAPAPGHTALHSRAMQAIREAEGH